VLAAMRRAPETTSSGSKSSTPEITRFFGLTIRASKRDVSETISPNPARLRDGAEIVREFDTMEAMVSRLSDDLVMRRVGVVLAPTPAAR
jgi:hypothetical protein